MTPPSSSPSVSLLAGIDIGTLTCRLLIATVSPEGTLTEIQSDRRILRLGEGVAQQGRLQPQAIARVIDTLREWRRVVASRRPDAEIAVATSAVRDAANREEFLERVRSETGFDVEVISGEEEARRTLLGIRSGLPRGVQGLLGLDIGGGSTELIADRPGQLPRVRSMQIGVVRLTEQVFHHDPPTQEERRRALALVGEAAVSVRADLGPVEDLTMVGTAGTITTLAAMALKLPAYEPARIHNYRLTRRAVAAMEQELFSRSTAERRGLPGLEPGREEVIVAGALILGGVMDQVGSTECLVSDLGLREGVVLDLAGRIRANG